MSFANGLSQVLWGISRWCFEEYGRQQSANAHDPLLRQVGSGSSFGAAVARLMQSCGFEVHRVRDDSASVLLSAGEQDILVVMTLSENGPVAAALGVEFPATRLPQIVVQAVEQVTCRNPRLKFELYRSGDVVRLCGTVRMERYDFTPNGLRELIEALGLEVGGFGIALVKNVYE